MIKKYAYLNNYSDIIAYEKDDEFKKMVTKLDNTITVVNSHLIHKKKRISSTEQFIFNLDNYITYIKSIIHIDQIRLRYIINNTIYNKYNKILFNKTYYYDNPNNYINGFKKMFYYKYNHNYSIISKYIKLKKLNFDQLINFINTNKNAYLFFENISKNNMQYYINLIEIIN